MVECVKLPEWWGDNPCKIMDFLDNEIPDNSVDEIVTDPPYGYSFMGKDWDKVVLGVEYWKECLRVLKPGSFALVMSAPRQDVLGRMIVNLTDAGFDTGFTSLYWAYAQGFPKAMNIGKAVDKRLGAEREVISGVPKPEEYSGKFDQRSSTERPKDNGAITPEAKALDGSYAGYQPKPAVEVILVAMKPLDEKTYVDQALKNGKGITWLDACRIPYDKNDDAYEKGMERAESPRADIRGGNFHTDDWSEKKRMVESGMSPDGRFPANLLVSNDALNDGTNYNKGGDIPNENIMSNEVYGEYSKPRTWDAYGDSGSFSRYFDLDKWWIARLRNLPKEVQKTFPFIITPKASKSEKNKGLEDLEEKQKVFNGQSETPSREMKDVEERFTTQPSANFHPTVKPVKLFLYLIALGSREGDIVLDPFVGSGTLLVSADVMHRQGIGTEINPEMGPIIAGRIKRENYKLEDFL